MTNHAGDNEIGFFVYHTDWLFYKQLKDEGRIKTGEMTQYLRKAFRDFLEAHRDQPKRIKPTKVNLNTEMLASEVNNTETVGSVTETVGSYKPASNNGPVDPEGA